MKLLFNDLITLRQRSGIGAYAHHLLESLPEASTGVELVRLSETLTGMPLKMLSRRVPGSRGEKHSQWKGMALNAVNRLRWKEMALNAVSHYVKLSSRLQSWDLYHEPDAIPLPITAPTVVTVHDLSVTLFPQWHPQHRVRKYEAQLEKTLRIPQYFFSDSLATKQDMQKHWGVSPEKIEVVPLAPRPMFRKISKTYKRKYFLFVGTIEPRKNVGGLIRAYRTLPASIRAQYPLLIAGGHGWGGQDFSPLLGADVQQLGYVDDETLVDLMNGAIALVYPSFYEGFGLPPLEAMACEVPVICSDRGSLKEVVEDAALIIEPEDEAQIARAMEQIVVDRELRELLIQKGKENLKRFSWEATAVQTARGYLKAHSASKATSR